VNTDVTMHIWIYSKTCFLPW